MEVPGLQVYLLVLHAEMSLGPKHYPNLWCGLGGWYVLPGQTCRYRALTALLYHCKNYLVVLTETWLTQLIDLYTILGS